MYLLGWIEIEKKCQVKKKKACLGPVEEFFPSIPQMENVFSVQNSQNFLKPANTRTQNGRFDFGDLLNFRTNKYLPVLEIRIPRIF
jgi:hypothetical protein